MARLDVNVGGTSLTKPPIMDIADYLKQVSQTAGANFGGCRRRCSNKTTMLTN